MKLYVAGFTLLVYYIAIDIGLGQDVNECLLPNPPCGENADCLDTSEWFVCECKQGYVGNGLNCTDVDECSLSIPPCDENAGCQNTVGSYLCECNQGYVGNGLNCTVSG